MAINKYGLGRTIPTAIALQIRREAGFGCVICGVGIFEYEHIDPEYNEATEHDPDKMTLLCDSCHGKVTRNIWSKEKVWEAKRNPKAKQQGFSNDWFDISGKFLPYIQFGGTITKNCIIPLMVFGIPIIKIEPPEQINTPFLLSAIFYDLHGNVSLEIVKNEWRINNDQYDATFKGKVLTIKSPDKNVCLQLKVDPPNGIIIEKLLFQADTAKITVTKDCIQIGYNCYYGGSIRDSMVGFEVIDSSKK